MGSGHVGGAKNTTSTCFTTPARQRGWPSRYSVLFSIYIFCFFCSSLWRQALGLLWVFPRFWWSGTRKCCRLTKWRRVAVPIVMLAVYVCVYSCIPVCVCGKSMSIIFTTLTCFVGQKPRSVEPVKWGLSIQEPSPGSSCARWCWWWWFGIDANADADVDVDVDIVVVAVGAFRHLGSLEFGVRCAHWMGSWFQLCVTWKRKAHAIGGEFSFGSRVL